MADLHTLTAADAARRIASGDLRSETLTGAYLEQIEAREPEIEAFVYVDRDTSMDEARIRDREPARGPLHGVPIAIKDVFDTFDMPAAYGSPIYRNHQPPQDSAIVAMIREKGGVILGKTVTPEFATQHPPKTHNPHDLSRSPGGSSAGSAAAVAAGMAPIGIGSQTTGSVIRPAAYCGTVGYKPSFHAINVSGMKPLAPSMDTVGILSKTVEDAMLLATTLWETEPIDLDDAVQAAPRIAFCRTPQWSKADDYAQVAMEEAVSRLSKAGANIDEISLSPEFDQLEDAIDTLVGFEMWRTLTFEREMYPSLLSPRLKELLAMGEVRTGEGYRAALKQAVTCRALFAEMMKDYDVVLSLPATGEAPAREEGTGDPTFCKIWTVMYGPSVTVPAGQGPNGLPLGVQLAAPYGDDDRALVAAEWIHRALV